MESLNERMLGAAQNSELDTVEELVSLGADINFTDQWGYSAIFCAAWEGNQKALDLFYHLGAKISV